MDKVSATLAASVIFGAYGNRLQLWSFDQAQGNTQIMQPLLQFVVHNAPFGKYLDTDIKFLPWTS